jgi:hypothetical protein
MFNHTKWQRQRELQRLSITARRVPAVMKQTMNSSALTTSTVVETSTGKSWGESELLQLA